MEDLSLPSALILVWDLRRAIETNQSLHIGIKKFLERDIKCKFALEFKKWWENYRVNKEFLFKNADWSQWTMHQRILLQLTVKGLSGVAVYENLVELDQQMINSCDDDIEKHISLLPLILQIPLLGMLFPAILMLLLVPALRLLQV